MQPSHTFIMNTKPKNLVRIISNLLEKCSMNLDVKIVPENATDWINEGIADTAVEIAGTTAVIPGYDNQFQAVKIINGEYMDLGYTSKSAQKVAVRAIAAYVQMRLRCSIEELI